MKSFYLIIVASIISCQKSTNQDLKVNKHEANKVIVEQYFIHFNNHEWDKMADMYIDNPEMKDPAYGLKNIKISKSDIVKKYKELHQMIPDIHDNVLKMYHSEDNVTVEFESSGTAPDGTKFVLPICTIFEIKDGKISKDLTYYDNFEEPKE